MSIITTINPVITEIVFGGQNPLTTYQISKTDFESIGNLILENIQREEFKYHVTLDMLFKLNPVFESFEAFMLLEEIAVIITKLDPPAKDTLKQIYRSIKYQIYSEGKATIQHQ